MDQVVHDFIQLVLSKKDLNKKDDMISAVEYLGNVNTKYGIYFVYGNHDKGYYNKNQETKLREELKKNNVIILEDALVEISNKIILIGNKIDDIDKRVIDITNVIIISTDSFEDMVFKEELKKDIKPS